MTTAKEQLMSLPPPRWHVVFLKKTQRPWEYAEYKVAASTQEEATKAAWKKLEAEVGTKRAGWWQLWDIQPE